MSEAGANQKTPRRITMAQHDAAMATMDAENRRLLGLYVNMAANLAECQRQLALSEGRVQAMRAAAPGTGEQPAA